jgi:hypothetical protein
MSTVRIFALGSLVFSISGGSTIGESIHSAQRSHHQHPARMISTPDSLVTESPSNNPVVIQNISHALAAENLAVNSSGPGRTWSSVTSSSNISQGSISGLFLGLTGGSQGSVANSSPSPLNLVANSGGAPPIGVSQPSPVPSPAPAVTLTMPTMAPPVRDDAFINFGSGPYPEASKLIAGTPLPFFDSPVFAHFFGPNGPSSSDVTNFEEEVLSTIKSTYNNAGLPITLTSDPATPAVHTISVVSGASYLGNSAAIGITDIGNNGFSFIDKLSGTQTVDQLATAIGHNISHELMHAFGLANHPEQVGPYVDAASSTLQTLSDPSTGFSQAAARLLATLNFQAVGQSITAGAQLRVDGDQVLINGASAVPEPSTVAIWAVIGAMVIVHRRKAA